MDTLLNPDKAAQYMSNKEKAMEDIRVAWQKVVTLNKYVSLRVFYHKVILIVVNSIIFH